MFEPDATLSFLSTTRDRVVLLSESINQPQISVPGQGSQAAQSHLCGIQNPDGSFSLFAALHFAETGATTFYVYQPRKFGLDLLPVAEADGLQFLESMGFMLDNLNFPGLPAQQQQELFLRIPLFSQPKRAAPASAVDADPGEDPRKALSRFLASF